MNSIRLTLMFWAGLFCGLQSLPTYAQMHGVDLLPVFARAHHGLPLRVTAMGGSITQAGKVWVTDWLGRQFPKSDVVMSNAGMSGTGSDLGIFRVERDVIVTQPDLVFIKFAVNDFGL